MLCSLFFYLSVYIYYNIIPPLCFAKAKLKANNNKNIHFHIWKTHHKGFRFFFACCSRLKTEIVYSIFNAVIYVFCSHRCESFAKKASRCVTLPEHSLEACEREFNSLKRNEKRWRVSRPERKSSQIFLWLRFFVISEKFLFNVLPHFFWWALLLFLYFLFFFRWLIRIHFYDERTQSSNENGKLSRAPLKA